MKTATKKMAAAVEGLKGKLAAKQSALATLNHDLLQNPENVPTKQKVNQICG